MKDRLREARKARNLTLRQVANEIHVSESAVSKFEHGVQPSEQTLVLFCERLGVNRQWLETGEGDMFTRQPDEAQAIAAHVAREYGSDPLLRAFMTSYLQLDAPKRELVLEIVESFTTALRDALASGKPAPDISEHIHARVDALTALPGKIPMIQGTDEAIIQMKYQSKQEQRELEQTETLQSDPT